MTACCTACGVASATHSPPPPPLAFPCPFPSPGPSSGAAAPPLAHKPGLIRGHDPPPALHCAQMWNKKLLPRRQIPKVRGAVRRQPCALGSLGRRAWPRAVPQPCSRACVSYSPFNSHPAAEGAYGDLPPIITAANGPRFTSHTPLTHTHMLPHPHMHAAAGAHGHQGRRPAAAHGGLRDGRAPGRAARGLPHAADAVPGSCRHLRAGSAVRQVGEGTGKRLVLAHLHLNRRAHAHAFCPPPTNTYVARYPPDTI